MGKGWGMGKESGDKCGKDEQNGMGGEEGEG